MTRVSGGGQTALRRPKNLNEALDLISEMAWHLSGAEVEERKARGTPDHVRASLRLLHATRQMTRAEGLSRAILDAARAAA